MAKKEKSSSSSSSALPPEMVEMILSKLPSKSLLRFKTVSKSWNTIISNPVFVQNHLHSSPNNLFLCPRRDYSEEGFSLFKLQGQKFHHEEVLKRPYGSWNVILCECNGVLLLSEHRYSKEYYMLWNPSTRREMYFQFPYYGYRTLSHGICYDSATDDFKVVLIAGDRYAIYSCKNSSWTEKMGTQYYGCCSGIYVDGATYWLLRDVGNNAKQLVYFDPKADELKTLLQKPKQQSGDHLNLFVSVACLKSNLCLCGGEKRNGDDKIKNKIWIKENGIVWEDPSWKELITVDDYSNAQYYWWFEPICFVDDKILMQLDRKKLAYYSPSEKTFEYFEETENDIYTHYGNQLVPYRNSLYFPTRPVS